MPDQPVAFLPQPIQMMARQGEGFTQEVIQTLRRWIASDYTETVRAEREGKLFALSAEPSTPWHIVVLLRQRSHEDFGANVCWLEFGHAEESVDQFVPLIAVDHILPAMQVKLGNLRPTVFSAFAFGQGYTEPRFKAHHVPANLHFGRTIDLWEQVDASGHRWASSMARSRFKDVFDRARQQPQIVERGDEDLVVMSRSYLKELTAPTTARAMAQHFRNRGLSTEGMGEPEMREMSDLEVLPRLAPK